MTIAMVGKILLRETNPSDCDFAFEAKKQAMRVTIESKWGWDEGFQLDLHKQRWSEKPWFIIEEDGVAVGTVSLHQIDNQTLRFGEFYLLDAHRNKGIGTCVLRAIVKSGVWDLKRRPVSDLLPL